MYKQVGRIKYLNLLSIPELDLSTLFYNEGPETFISNLLAN